MAITSTLVLAHRGASADYPENTIAAFRGAAEQGADGVELDVRLTANGDLVVHHDPSYPDGATVWSTPLEDAPDGTVTLAAALDACAGLVNVEIKNSPGDLGEGTPYSFDVVDAVAELVLERRRAGNPERILVSSFDEPTLTHLVANHSGIDAALLGYDLSEAAVAAAAAAGFAAMHPWDGMVDPAAVERVLGAGMALNTWTIDDPERMAQLAGMGVSAIVTNVPLLAKAVIADLRESAV